MKTIIVSMVIFVFIFCIAKIWPREASLAVSTLIWTFIVTPEKTWEHPASRGILPGSISTNGGKRFLFLSYGDEVLCDYGLSFRGKDEVDELLDITLGQPFGYKQKRARDQIGSGLDVLFRRIVAGHLDCLDLCLIGR